MDRIQRRVCLHQLGRSPAILPVILTIAWGLLLASPESARGDQVSGSWGAVQTLPYAPINANMLPTGKVLFYEKDNALIWDPDTGSLTTTPKAGYNLFCNGHTFIEDGKLFLAGGHINTLEGVANASYYDPFSNSWTNLPAMNAGRWYPTSVTLADGNVAVMSGAILPGTSNNTPQVWEVGSGSWRTLSSAERGLPLYPAAFLAPNGRVFVATATSRYLDTSGTGAWSTVAVRLFSGHDSYGSAAMYDNGKVIYVGGGSPPVATAEVIDLNATSSAWSSVAPMPQARRQHNVTILPDGTLLVTGGSSSDGFDTDDGPKPAINWDPATNVWTTWATEEEYRGYHSEALLLPDGRVVSAGGSYQNINHPSLQVFSPPYLFKGPRPEITSAPSSVAVGQTFFVETQDYASVTNVNWIRLSSVTHTKNMNQRINRLAFDRNAGLGGLNVTAPASGNLSPPGHYMLFILNDIGVPSLAKIIKLATVASSSPPAAPNNLVATAVSENQVNLVWTDNSNNEDGFDIEHSTDNSNFTRIATVGTDANTYSHTGLTPNTRYYHRVRAFNAGGESAYSNTATEDTTVPASPPPSPPSPPPLPPPPPPAATCNGLPATIVGTDSSETINGTSGNDVIHGLGGNDLIRGGGGNDVICGGNGRDTLFGHGGRDTLLGGRGQDVLSGGTGRDRCAGGSGPDTAVKCESKTSVP